MRCRLRLLLEFGIYLHYCKLLGWVGIVELTANQYVKKTRLFLIHYCLLGLQDLRNAVKTLALVWLLYWKMIPLFLLYVPRKFHNLYSVKSHTGQFLIDNSTLTLTLLQKAFYCPRGQTVPMCLQHRMVYKALKVVHVTTRYMCHLMKQRKLKLHFFYNMKKVILK